MVRLISTSMALCDCINDDDDDYGVSVDMAGILGNPGQDVANAVVDLVDLDDAGLGWSLRSSRQYRKLYG